VVVDAFLLVCLLVFEMFFSINQGPNKESWESWSPEIFVVEPEDQNKPFSTWSPDRNADSGQIEPWSQVTSSQVNFI